MSTVENLNQFTIDTFSFTGNMSSQNKFTDKIHTTQYFTKNALD